MLGSREATGLLVWAPKEARVPLSLMLLPLADRFHPEPLSTQPPSSSSAHCFCSCFSCTHFLSGLLRPGGGGRGGLSPPPWPLHLSPAHRGTRSGWRRAREGRKRKGGGGWRRLAWFGESMGHPEWEAAVLSQDTPAAAPHPLTAPPPNRCTPSAHPASPAWLPSTSGRAAVRGARQMLRASNVFHYERATIR